MGWFDWLGGGKASKPTPEVRAQGGTQTYPGGLTDPRFLEFIRTGGAGRGALFNTAVFRCVDLISTAIATLPFRPMRRGSNGALIEATDHPLFSVLMVKPNGYQTAFEFKQLMQMRALVDGDAFARVVRVGSRVIGLLPLDSASVRLNSLGMPVYTTKGGELPADDVFHLRGLSSDGLNGFSRVRQAARAIGLAEEAEEAAIRIFTQGISAGGVLTHPGKLSPEAQAALVSQLEARYAGSENAGKWMVTQEGMTATPWAQTSKDSQQLERSQHQVEEIARVFGVPRPLMGVDDTSWGTGIEQLAILFVQFALAGWFKAWEERANCTLLSNAERGAVHMDFDERELLRGSMKDQAEFFAKALGGGGNRPWMEPNEVRELSGLGRHTDGGGLAAPNMMGNRNVAA